MRLGRRVKWESDPSLAQSHESGAKMALILGCVHDVYGVLAVSQPQHWAVHLALAEQSRLRLRDIDARIEQLQVQKNNSRHVGDPVMIRDMYLLGTNLAVHTVLG